MALESVLRQSRPVDRIIVVSDNSTDKTVQIARLRANRGVEVVETVNNTHRKAGALNQVLAWLLPSLSWNDAILGMDADTVLSRRYVERAEARLTGKVGAVGPAYTGRPDGGLLGVLQRNEYARFNRQIARRRGRTAVLSGTATLASVRALRSVFHGRQTGRLPNGPGSGVYNPTTGTEDYELTLCLRRLGYRPLTPANCGVITDVMDTLGKWHGQRVRWYWGAMTNLRPARPQPDYGAVLREHCGHLRRDRPDHRVSWPAAGHDRTHWIDRLRAIVAVANPRDHHRTRLDGPPPGRTRGAGGRAIPSRAHLRLAAASRLDPCGSERCIRR